MEYKKIIKSIIREYLHGFMTQRKVQEQFSELISSKIDECFRKDGLLSSLSQKDFTVRFSDGRDFDDITITVIFPEQADSLPLSINGQVLNNIRESFGLLPHHLFVGVDQKKGYPPRLYVQWFLDHMSYGAGLDWEKEIESIRNEKK